MLPVINQELHVTFYTEIKHIEVFILILKYHVTYTEVTV